MSFDLLSLLTNAVKEGVSDVHLRANEAPIVRKNGRIVKTNLEPLSDSDLESIVKATLPPIFENRIHRDFDLDFSYEIKGVSRFRINLSRELGHIALVFRLIPFRIPNFDELKLPSAVEQFAHLNNGIIFITGPTGSGKSTTLAALLDFINQNYQKHIVTIEDPIEFIYENKKGLITQHQVEVDTASFPDGIKYALRQDPDVILIGEIRDRETLESALKAAETGHLVFSTIHTNDVQQTIRRIVNMFEPQERDFIRKQLSNSLRGVLAQKLILKENEKGRVVACELLIVTPTVRDYIMKDNIDEVYELVKQGSFNNMLTMNMSLYNLLDKEIISEKEALAQSDNQIELQQMLRGAYHGTIFEDL